MLIPGESTSHGKLETAQVGSWMSPCSPEAKSWQLTTGKNNLCFSLAVLKYCHCWTLPKDASSVVKSGGPGPKKWVAARFRWDWLIEFRERGMRRLLDWTAALRNYPGIIHSSQTITSRRSIIWAIGPPMYCVCMYTANKREERSACICTQNPKLKKV